MRERSRRARTALLLACLLVPSAWCQEAPRRPAPVDTESESRPRAQIDFFGILHSLKKKRQPVSDAPIHLEHPVVLAHGAAWFEAIGKTSARPGQYWSGVVERFQDLGIPTIAPVVTPAGSIEERAAELKQAIESTFPRGKVHILAHSMGGLDARYMIKMLGMGRRVRTLTTVSTPHRGSFYADFANRFIAQGQGLDWLAGKYQLNFKALQSLSVYNIENYFNPVVTDHPLVDYYSYAGVTSLRRLPLPYWGMKLVISVAERAAVGKTVGRATRAALDEAIPSGARNALGLIRDGGASLDWIDPEHAGRSDSVVSVSSARWGTYLGEIPEHHLAQIGSGNKNHVQIWEDIVRRLASMGY